MASIEIALASIAAGHRSVADADVQRRLRELGIVGPAAIHLIATSEAGLRSAAAEILGDGFGNDAWFALLRLWQSSTYQGRQWLQQRGRELAAGPPPVAGPPPLVVEDPHGHFVVAASPPPPRTATTSQPVPLVPVYGRNRGLYAYDRYQTVSCYQSCG